MNDKALHINDIGNIISNIPTGQLVFLGLVAATWLVGGNTLIAFHYKRIGKAWYSGLKPFAFPFRNFNLNEWLIMALLAVVSLGFLLIALSYGDG